MAALTEKKTLEFRTVSQSFTKLSSTGFIDLFFQNQTAHSPASYYTPGDQSADHEQSFNTFLVNQKDGNWTVVVQRQFYRILSVRSKTLYIATSFLVITDKSRQHSVSNGVALSITLLHKVI